MASNPRAIRLSIGPKVLEEDKKASEYITQQNQANIFATEVQVSDHDEEESEEEEEQMPDISKMMGMMGGPNGMPDIGKMMSMMGGAGGQPGGMPDMSKLMGMMGGPGGKQGMPDIGAMMK